MRLLFLFLSFGCAFCLAACGLTPVYGTHANSASPAVEKAFDSVYVDIVPDRSGQKLRNILIDTMAVSGRNAKGDASYRLAVDGLSESVRDLGIAKDATATRSQITLETHFALHDMRGLKPVPVFERDISAVSSFNRLSSQYTTLVTEDDARDQTIRLLADQIVTQLELYFSDPSLFPASQQAAHETDVQGH